jgi:hypothetical protein
MCSGLEARPPLRWLPKFAVVRLLRLIAPRQAKLNVFPATCIVDRIYAR